MMTGVILPPGWDCSPPGGVELRYRAGGSSDFDWMRELAAAGCRRFLIGAEAAARGSGFLVATDHLNLFGDGPLVGPNRDDAGPRFPSLPGLYAAPEGPWKPGVVCRVPDWRLATPAELAALGSDALASEGIDEAIVAGHAGARVMLILRCHAWRRENTGAPPVAEALKLLTEVV